MLVVSIPDVPALIGPSHAKIIDESETCDSPPLVAEARGMLERPGRYEVTPPVMALASEVMPTP